RGSEWSSITHASKCSSSPANIAKHQIPYSHYSHTSHLIRLPHFGDPRIARAKRRSQPLIHQSTHPQIPRLSPQSRRVRSATTFGARLLMRAIWKGSISFSLVNIPISLYPATRREELKFHLLRKTDLSPIRYKRVAEADSKEVPWEEIVKGYEYEKGQY